MPISQRWYSKSRLTEQLFLFQLDLMNETTVMNVRHKYLSTCQYGLSEIYRNLNGLFSSRVRVSDFDS